MARRRLPPAVVFVAALLACAPAAAQTPAEYYDQNCAACHTIGQGTANGGPDLKDVTRRRDREWLVRFLLDPDDFRTDPAVAQMIKDAGGLEMPTTDGLTREMAIALLQIIEQRGTTARASTAARGESTMTAADVAHGRELFTGRARLAAAGPACMQCHDAAALAAPGGGRLGPDLTRVSARLGGARGLSAWLRAAPTPVMRTVYRSAALTPEESSSLAAFFEDLAAQPAAPRRSPLLDLRVAALAMTLIVMALIGAFGGRFRGVRAALVTERIRRPAAPGGSR